MRSVLLYCDPSESPFAAVEVRSNRRLFGWDSHIYWVRLQANDKWDHFINTAQVYFSGNVGSLEPQVREVFRQVDPNLTIVSVQPMHQLVDVQFDQQRAIAQLSGLFGILALILASIGLYGVMTYTVARQSTDIGIRLAIGAKRLNVIKLVLRGAFAQVASGLMLGVPGAIVIAKLLSTRLHQVASFDPSALAFSVVSLLAGACLACILPAYRVAHIDPIRSLARNRRVNGHLLSWGGLHIVSASCSWHLAMMCALRALFSTVMNDRLRPPRLCGVT
jgi:hypothetical protein